MVPGKLARLSREESQKARRKKSVIRWMLKAAAGGGGKGMRAVRAAASLGSAYDSASSEAARFCDGEIYIES